MFSGVSERTRTFSFRSRNQPDSREETLNIHVFDVRDQSQARYSSYIWPSAPILALYLWEHRHELSGKHILELGAGTALPGILAAKCGAYVTLSESALLPKSIQDLERSCKLNNLNSSQVQVIGLTWGLFTYSVLQLKPVDLIISSDCFYEPITFEDILATVAFLLEKNPRAKFLSTYQERSADWSIEHLLNKWNLRCDEISIDTLGEKSGVNIDDFLQNHTIHLLQISRRS
ncbi:histone-arginine methyltransferase METTL23 [Planococcus citri]|uniref:histone-arginine methyltransferase METTL23 n=1 Tax=Planococcus citri TaxID=170843 RepID=UPI0031F75CBA